MNIIRTEIEGVLILEPKVFEDERGYFMEGFSQRVFDEKVVPVLGYPVHFVQDNESRSSYGVVRGLHLQRPPYSQAKLVRCIEGRVMDIVVDIRRGSPTYRRHVAVELSGQNKRQLFIPKGLAHGFAVLSETAVFQYKCDEFYHPESDTGIYPLDPSLGIDWKVPEERIVLSPKDRGREKLDDDALESRFGPVVSAQSAEDPVTVTSPLLPDLSEMERMLKEIWDSKWITNNGSFHRQLEKELAAYLKVPYISLFTNGTLPLLTALQALRITGEVITTPYSFVATTHSIWWNGCKPVFVDIDPATGNIDPEKIEAAITTRTTAIMPVHVYGKPCRVREIQEIADRYHLKVIYDAAHAFGVEVNGESILNAGDLSTLSFHATKVFNTLEGGAMVIQDEQTKRNIDFLKNFGFQNETTVVGPGINGKVDEVRSAVGLLNLRKVDDAIAARRKVAVAYRGALRDVPGIRFFDDMPGVRHNYSYFPIFVDAEEYGMTRDELYERMKAHNVLGRRYFYPLISDFRTYRGLPSASPKNLPNAVRMADRVICLPMHHRLCEADVDRIVEIITKR